MLFDAAFTVKEAVDFMTKNAYDLVFLDHDLGGQQMVDSFAEEETGYLVAKWMAEHKPKVERVVIHTLNPAGAKNMDMALRSAEYETLRCPFTRLVKELPNLLLISLQYKMSTEEVAKTLSPEELEQQTLSDAQWAQSIGVVDDFDKLPARGT